MSIGWMAMPTEKILDFIGIIACITLLVCICAAAIKFCLDSNQSVCAYCQTTISEHADTVICTDGRRYHAECYLRYIEEGTK